MKVGFAGKVAAAFLDSKLTPLIVAASLGLGALALVATPREEEPQIRVPMVDVMVAWPGAEAAEVENRIVAPIERILWGVPGVEHIYSVSRPGMGMVTVRFKVNESNEASLVKVYERQSAMGWTMPRDIMPPIVELHSIDDVPFLTLTLWGEGWSSDRLRPLAAELAQELSEVPEASRAQLTGGQPRVVRVEPDPDRMAAAGISWMQLTGALRAASVRQAAGTAVRDNREVRVEVGPLFRSSEEVGRVVVGLAQGRPVYVSQVARVVDGPDEATDAVFFSPGPAGASEHAPAGKEHPAVTIALSKRTGANATVLAENVLRKVEDLRPRLLPADVHVDVTRDYGETAQEKSNELVDHLLIATLSVVVLISLAMGWRSGLVVGVAVPVTLALTLFIYFLAGYTLNRVTLFALIFSIGILVDDAIVVVENIERHYRERKGQSMLRTAVEAVDEVGNPTILATFTVIAAILPMAFVRGLMGPYMRPIPTGASAAMLFSLAIAFMVTPWAAYRLLKHADLAHGHGAPGQASGGGVARVYRRVMKALVTRPSVRWPFFGAVVVALLLAVATVGVGLVKVKMLPFDNKSEFQVLIDHPEGTPLEVTLETARRMKDYLATVPEVRDVQLYAGDAAPFNFNGLVRHYFLRRAPQWADLQVNLSPKHDRDAQSHDIAKRVRPALVEIARRRGANVKVVEIPPGPPVMDTMVAEIYGPTEASRHAVPRPGEGGPQGHPREGGGGDARRAGRRPRRRARGGPGVARAGPRPRPPLGRRPGEPGAPARDAGRLPPRGPGLDRGPGPPRAGPRGPATGAEGPQAGRLRHGRPGGGAREPRLRDPRPEPEARRLEAAGRVAARAVLGRAAGDVRSRGDEVGRRVADHVRGVPRPRDRVRRGARPDRDPRDRVVPVLRRAPRHPAADPPVAHRHPAGALALRGVLHRDLDDRVHRRGGNHREELDHPRRLHGAAPAPGDVPRGGGRGGGRAALPADRADCGRRRGGVAGDAVRPHLPGPRDQPHDGLDRRGDPLARHRAGPLLPDRPPRPRRGAAARGGRPRGSPVRAREREERRE
jgi:preprotein translocase subunit SecF